MTGGVGDQAMSTLPATTARAAAVPLSKGRNSTSAPCFLKKPCVSATCAMVTEKIGGMPGKAMVSFLPCAAAGDAAAIAASSAPPTSRVESLRNMGIPPVVAFNLLSFFGVSALKLEFRRARFAHQRIPYPLAQLAEAGMLQGRARAGAWQVDRDGFVDARRPALEHDHAMAEQHGLFDRMRDKDHGGRPLLPNAEQLELQNLAGLGIDRREGLVHEQH